MSVSAIFRLGLGGTGINAWRLLFKVSYLGVGVGSFTDKDSSTEATDSQLASAGQLPDPSRRRFSRSALAGSAVLLSLGNRAAWGQTIGCMSVATLNSFNPATGHFISAPAGRPQHNEQLAARIHSISSPPNYLGTNGTDSSCKDPNSLDGICLVRGDCAPPPP